MNPALHAAVRYLVLKSFADPVVVEALYRMYIDNASLSDVARELGLENKGVARGYKQRIQERLGFSSARAVIKTLYPYLRSIEPIIEYSRGTATCRLCGAVIIGNGYKKLKHIATLHVFHDHKELVEEYTEKAIRYLVEKVKRNVA